MTPSVKMEVPVMDTETERRRGPIPSRERETSNRKSRVHSKLRNSRSPLGNEAKSLHRNIDGQKLLITRIERNLALDGRVTDGCWENQGYERGTGVVDPGRNPLASETGIGRGIRIRRIAPILMVQSETLRRRLP